MSNSEDDVAFIRALAELLHATDLTEIEVKREYGEADELKVRLSRAALAPPAPIAAPAPMAPPVPVSAGVAPRAESVPDPTDKGPDPADMLTSPMVGTVYLAAEPESDPFVAVGDTVAEGDTVLIIEAMKTMNQIPAPKSGKVTRILVNNAEPVEFGAVLMIIE